MRVTLSGYLQPLPTLEEIPLDTINGSEGEPDQMTSPLPGQMTSSWLDEMAASGMASTTFSFDDREDGHLPHKGTDCTAVVYYEPPRETDSM